MIIIIYNSILPRTTAPYHTDDPLPISTLPITDADCAINELFILGKSLPNFTDLVDGITNNRNKELDKIYA